MIGTPCRVSADLRAHQRREDHAPDYICDRCQAALSAPANSPRWEPSRDGWLVCQCGDALCEDCCIAIRAAEEASGFARYLGWEACHNEGYCSPRCMMDEIERLRKAIARMAVEAVR